MTRNQGNRIGTTADGSAALGNGTDGVFINRAAGNIIGGTAPGAGNVISGNGSVGLQVFGRGATGNVVQGNLIGVDASGANVVSNRFGLFLNAAAGNTIGGAGPGEANVVRGNLVAEVIDTFALPAVVQAVQPVGDGSVVRGIVLTFSTEMNPARVQDRRNYRVRPLRRGLRVAVGSVTYDDVARTATLTFSRPINGDVPLRLVINATSRRGVADSRGRLLDGDEDGIPGGTFVARVGPPGGDRAAEAEDRPSARAVDHLIRTGEFPTGIRMPRGRR